MDLPPNFRIHLVIHVSYTVPYVAEPGEVASAIGEPPEPVPVMGGHEYEAEEIFAYRRRGRGPQFLTLLAAESRHDADMAANQELCAYRWHHNDMFSRLLRRR